MNSQHVVAVFVGRSDQQRELEEGLVNAGLRVAVLHSSEELHRLLNHQRVDALLVEHEQQGFLSGLEILERMQQQLLRPVTLLLGQFSPAERARAAALKVDHLADWSAGIEPLCQTIQAALLVATTKRFRIPYGARQLVQDSGCIRPVPQLVARLAYYLSDDRASTMELAKEISADPRITADLLRMVNSAAFGLGNRMIRLADAVSFLGIRRTACLIMAAEVQRSQAGFDRRLPDDMLKWYRTRSLLTASSAGAFAKLSSQSKDHAFTLGLLQDLGILVLAHHFGQRYLHLVERFRSIALLHLDACERQLFSFTHADVSAALLQKWDLPASMVCLVLDHHEDQSGQGHSQQDLDFLQAMRLGEAIANMSDIPSPQRNAHLQQLLRTFSAPQQTGIRTCLAEAIATAAEMGKLFNMPVPLGERWNDLVDRIRDELQVPTLASPLNGAIT